MYGVPRMAVFCSPALECLPGTVINFFWNDLRKLPVARMVKLCILVFFSFFHQYFLSHANIFLFYFERSCHVLLHGMVLYFIICLLLLFYYYYYYHHHQESGSSVGIPTGYWLDGRSSNPGRCKIFLFSTASTLALGPTYTISTGGSFPAGKATGSWSWPLTSIYCRGQEWWSYTSTPTQVFMAGCLIN
jgi:hypothetical protein